MVLLSGAVVKKRMAKMTRPVHAIKECIASQGTYKGHGSLLRA